MGKLTAKSRWRQSSARADERPVPKVAKQHRISAQTIYAWRQHFAQRLRGRMAPGLLAWRLGRARRVPVFGRVGPPRRHVCHDRWPARMGRCCTNRD